MTQKLVVRHVGEVDEMLEALPLVLQKYDFSAADFEGSLREMVQENGYKMAFFYYNGELVAVCGYWVLRMLYCGRYLQISNLIVDENCRGQGLGGKILRYFEGFAGKNGCEKLILDSHVENKRSHSLYFKEGFYVRGLHFMKDL